jgi:cytochrome c oxidase subunit IV
MLSIMSYSIDDYFRLKDRLRFYKIFLLLLLQLFFKLQDIYNQT